MAMDATSRRRWLGGSALVGALGMLILGQTLLQGQVRGWGFLAYWTGCFLLTGLAIVTAFRDLHALRDRTRQQQRELLESTIKDIQADARNKCDGSGARDRRKN